MKYDGRMNERILKKRNLKEHENMNIWLVSYTLLQGFDAREGGEGRK